MHPAPFIIFLWLPARLFNLVPMAGLEPAQLAPHAPQACVSTNFTTSACLTFYSTATNIVCATTHRQVQARPLQRVQSPRLLVVFSSQAPAHLLQPPVLAPLPLSSQAAELRQRSHLAP
jgi:hypothetical protein